MYDKFVTEVNLNKTKIPSNTGLTTKRNKKQTKKVLNRIQNF